MANEAGWVLLAGWRRWRETRRRKRRHRRHSKATDAGSCGLDACDGCDGCSGCDCNLGLLSLGTLLMLVPFLRSTPTPRPRSGRRSATAAGGVVLIRGYQRMLSRHLPTRCRYEPSCSEYGAQAVRRYGLLDGSRLIAARINRCTSEVPLGTPDPLQ
ncbi:membrane protein insertion efficiency factor YidD [Cryptosporangium minutisporangium]|uniref:Membrane protein insertion efficiency factor YidD n=1 Tax=Cryptosporangium minutisporangium TaxID=113569 RepID=A0ABP6SWB3_9ACTN